MCNKTEHCVTGSNQNGLMKVTMAMSIKGLVLRGALLFFVGVFFALVLNLLQVCIVVIKK